ncbi:acetylornithine deacetylase [Terrimonas sp.]|uniref:ABC transporter permease n=1 Tax=Terrimonas sp. TaxID=1914338 RepID=UPI000D521E3E|nr:ABC transporter permease [Terrimonas sp.]PVD50418.1 acetylornithine deacetylase [Terrimonas sp.]
MMLKTIIRNFWKNKGYGFLNIFGLAIGITCAGLIFLWAENELDYDNFHTKKDQLYFIRENQKYDSYVATFGSTPALLAPAMQTEIPGIANTCRIGGENSTTLVSIGDRSVYASGGYADSSIFSMFTLPFTEGKAQSAFAQLYSMVITQSTAKKFFGDDKNVVGKTVRVDNKQDYIISGVIKDIPQNSSVKFEWIAPFKIWYNENESWAQYWGNNCLSTYVELKPGVNPASVNKLLYDFIQKREDQSIARPFLFALKDWRLRNEFNNGVQTGGGRIEYVRLFSIIAWIILLIACVNFMNLATARSEKRAREVGVRKVLGAGKGSLVFQFIGETMLMAALSAMLAVVLMVLILPVFNLLVQKNLAIGLSQPLHILSLCAITIICGLIAGSYPSLYLSSFNPVFVLKGLKIKTGSATFIRKGLVVFQFTISIILIVSTIVIYQQIQHVKSRNLGFNKNNLLQIDMNSEMKKNYAVVQQDLLQSGVIEDLAISNYNTLYDGNNTGGFTWEGKTSDNQVLISMRYVSPGYMKTTGMKILQGRDLVSTDSIGSRNMNVMITQSLEELMGKESAVGKTLRMGKDSNATVVNVVGVVNDYMYGNMYGKPDPVMFICVSPENASMLYARLKPGENIEPSLKKIEAVLRKDNPGYPFTYHFVDDQFNQMFNNEQLISKLSRVFSMLAIIISCLGLFGLAAYTAERRIKEIGIRKVLGASVTGIASLLSTEFLQLVLISCIVAFPVSWWMMHKWLQDYQYRIEINWWIFIAAGIAAIFIALLTIGFQSIRAAMANPVKSLRTE